MAVPEPGPPSEEAAFLGRMTASISHEIKNGLAILKEQAGLAGDLLDEKGGVPASDPARIREIVDKMRRRIDLTDEVVRDLNRLAHSADLPRQGIDLGEAVDLVVRLARRLARLHRVEIAWSPAPTPVCLEGSLPAVLQVLWLALEGLVRARDGGGAVSISVRDAGSSAVCDFIRTPLPDAEARRAVEEALAPRLVSAGAAVDADTRARLVVRFPLVAGRELTTKE